MMNRKRIVYPLFFVVLSLLIIIPNVQRAYAVNFVSNQTLTSCASATCTTAGLSVTSGNELIAVVDVNIFGASIQAITDSQGNSYTTLFNIGSNGNIKEIVAYTSAGSTSSDTLTVTTTNGFTSLEIDFLQFAGFQGIGQTSSTTTLPGSGSGTDSQTISTSPGSIVIETNSILNSLVDTCGTITIPDINRFNVCDTSGAIGLKVLHNEHDSVPQGSNSFTTTWSGWNTPAGFIHTAIELKGSTTVSTGLSTDCYGNCGSPAITLVNTNSTHTIAFNNSLTLFYEAQSALNGVLNNVTVNMAKTYTNGMQVSLGLYTAICNVGVLPFTAACPGQQQMVQTFTNPVKGRLVATQQGIQIQNTMWLGIAVSCIITGCDLNDTNTNVQLFNQSPSMPPILASASSLGNNKMGLWAWVTGTRGGVPPVIPVVSCGADFLCILAQSAINLTPSNPFVGALFLAFIWSIGTTFGLIFVSGYLAKSFGQSVTLPSGVFLMVWFGWFMFWPAIVGAIWFTIMVMVILFLTFASFSGSLLKGGVGVGGQTA